MEKKESWIELEESEGNIATRTNPNLLHAFHYTGSIGGRKVYPSGYAVKKTTEIASGNDSGNDLFYVKHAENSDVLGVSSDMDLAIDFAYGLLAGEAERLIRANPDYEIKVTEKLREGRESKLAGFLETWKTSQ